MGEYLTGAAVRDAYLSQPRVVFFGTSVQFSDQVLRLLRLDFEGVHFERIGGFRDLLELEGPPSVLILHGTDPNLSTHVEEVRERYPGAMIAVACDDLTIAQQLNQAGSSPPVSVLNLNAHLDVWLSLLRLLLCGHVYVPIEFVRSPKSDTSLPSEVQLTPREMEILPRIAEGKQNKMIAAELGLSEHTVKLHTHNIFSKLRVSNRTGAAKWFLSQVEG